VEHGNGKVPLTPLYFLYLRAESEFLVFIYYSGIDGFKSFYERNSIALRKGSDILDWTRKQIEHGVHRGLQERQHSASAQFHLVACRTEGQLTKIADRKHTFYRHRVAARSIRRTQSC
jgi:hypothetical protein